MYTEQELRLKSQEESQLDIDWYFRDSNGDIAIVTSAGGLLPRKITRDLPMLREIIERFRSLPVISPEVILTEEMKLEMLPMSTEQQGYFVQDVNYMASRGLFYYDKIKPNDYGDRMYYLKAIPSVSLHFENLDHELKSFIKDLRTSTRIRQMQNFSSDLLF